MELILDLDDLAEILKENGKIKEVLKCSDIKVDWDYCNKDAQITGIVITPIRVTDGEI